MIGNKPEDDESAQMKYHLDGLVVKVDSYVPRVFETHPSFEDALSPQLLEFKSALTRKQAKIDSDRVGLKRLINKKLEELRWNPIQYSEIDRKIAETEEWIEEKAALLNRQLSADSDELGKHLDDVMTNLQRRRELLTEDIMFQGYVQIHMMQKAFRKLEALSSEVDRLRAVAQENAILKELKAQVEDVIGGNTKTCKKIEKKQSDEKRKEVKGGVLVRLRRVFSLFSRSSPVVETMPKIPATLCGMPWNIKRTIVESLDFSPRNRLSQCSSEFKKLIDSMKIEYDRVAFSFYQARIEITIQQNGRKQLKLEFIDIGNEMCRKVFNDDKHADISLSFHDLAVSHLLRRINKPNVSIGQLEVHFIERLSSYLDGMNEMIIIQITSSLNSNRQCHPNLDKIQVKCVQVKHHGSQGFLRSFLSFMDMKTLENVILDYDSPQKQAHLSLVEEIMQKKDTKVVRLRFSEF